MSDQFNYGAVHVYTNARTGTRIPYRPITNFAECIDWRRFTTVYPPCRPIWLPNQIRIKPVVNPEIRLSHQTTHLPQRHPFITDLLGAPAGGTSPGGFTPNYSPASFLHKLIESLKGDGGRIVVDPERMLSLAQDIISCEADMTDCIAQLRSQINQLGNCWDSGVYDSFKTRTDKTNDVLDLYAKVVKNFAEFLKQVAEVYTGTENANNSYASQFI